MKKQFIFENLKLGNWNEGGHYLNVPLDVQCQLNGRKLTIELKRKNHGGYSVLEDVNLSFKGKNEVSKNIKRLSWGDSWKTEVEGLFDLKAITSNQYLYLEELVIAY